MSELKQLIPSLVRFSSNARAARLRLGAIVLAAALGGLASTGLVALINATLHEGAKSELLAAFVGLCVLVPVARFLSAWLLVHQVQDVVYNLRLALSRRILAAPLRRLEEIGPSRLLATMTEDVDSITNAMSGLPLVSLHLAVVLGCLGYLTYLSPALLLLVVAFVVVGIASYRLPMMRAQRHFHNMREEWDRMFGDFRGLTQGTKELKIHAPRRQAFLTERLEPTVGAIRRHNIAGNTIFIAANTWGQMLFFIAIGIILFGAPHFLSVDARTASGYALAIFFMATPLDVLLNMLPQLGRAVVSIQKIDRLGLSLELGGAAPAPPSLAPASWSSLEMRGVSHSYRHERDEEIFTLGPLDFAARPGDLVFIVGGNGSGKTTFAKLLSGLYDPEAGEIRLDGRTVDAAAVESYRQMFSIVFTDFFLFDSLLGLSSPDLGEQAQSYLHQLQLDRKVRIEGGGLSTVDLSQGQRKRLALLTAYLEDRPIYLFDEWAADQDPHFKEIFYRQLLPELKARGKTVFVISHDDRYYDVADRIVKLNYGRIEYDGAVAGYLHAPVAGEGLAVTV